MRLVVAALVKDKGADNRGSSQRRIFFTLTLPERNG